MNNEKPVNFIDYSQLMLKNGKINLLGQPLPSPLANSTNQKLNGNTADQRAKSNSVSPTKGKLEIPPNLIGVLFAQQQQQTLQQQQSQVYHNHGFFGFNRAIKTRKKVTIANPIELLLNVSVSPSRPQEDRRLLRKKYAISIM